MIVFIESFIEKYIHLKTDLMFVVCFLTQCMLGADMSIRDQYVSNSFCGLQLRKPSYKWEIIYSDSKQTSTIGWSSPETDKYE